MTTSDDCGACERFAVGVDVAFPGVAHVSVADWHFGAKPGDPVSVTIDGTTFEGPARDVGRALAALATTRGEDAVERTKTTARVRAGRPRRTDGRR